MMVGGTPNTIRRIIQWSLTFQTLPLYHSMNLTIGQRHTATLPLVVDDKSTIVTSSRNTLKNTREKQGMRQGHQTLTKASLPTNQEQVDTMVEINRTFLMKQKLVRPMTLPDALRPIQKRTTNSVPMNRRIWNVLVVQQIAHTNINLPQSP